MRDYFAKYPIINYEFIPKKYRLAVYSL